MPTAATAIPEVNYVTDSTGKRVFVQVSVEVWESLIERLQQLAVADARAGNNLTGVAPSASLSSLSAVPVGKVSLDAKTSLTIKEIEAAKARAARAAANWEVLSDSLPDLPEIGMEEILVEVKSVRKLRNKRLS